MAVLQQPSFSAVSRVFNRKNKGSLTAADWAVEFLHTEVACSCFQHAPTTRLATSFGSLGNIPPEKENENYIRLHSDSPSSPSSPISKNEPLQQTVQGVGAPGRAGHLPTYIVSQNFAIGSPAGERLRVLSAGAGSRRVCSVCLLPKITAEACSGTPATETATIGFPKPRRALRVKGLRQSLLQPCCCHAHTYCALRNPHARGEDVWIHQADGDEQVCQLCSSLPSGYSPPICSATFASYADADSPACPMRHQLPAYMQEPIDTRGSQVYCTIRATDQMCTCTSRGRASSARPRTISNSYASQSSPNDKTRAFRSLTPSGAPEHCPSSLNASEISQGTRAMCSCRITPTNQVVYNVHAPGCKNSAGKLVATLPPSKPPPVNTKRPATPAPPRTGSSPRCASVACPNATVASFPELLYAASTVRERPPAAEESLHHPLPKVHNADGLQQRLSSKVLQQLKTDIQQQLQQQVQQTLQIYMQQMQASSDQLYRCDQKGDRQILFSPQHGAQQDKRNNIDGITDIPLPQHDGSRWRPQTPAIETIAPVPPGGTLGQKSGTNTLKRSRSGPVNSAFQQWETLEAPNPIPEACAQRIQWLQSWSAEAEGSKEKQLLATLKELNTRPDFALVDVWRVFDPEGTGISEARGVQDGFSRLGIRCSGQEAQCFIWYYCPPHPIGLTFPIFASLFAAGGDEQLPLLRCIQQQNPCTVPAAYLALSSRTRKLLATFLRLALDKAISRWVARSLRTSGLTATAAVPGNLTVC